VATYNNKNNIQAAIEYLYQNDSIMKELIKKVGDCTLKPSNDYFVSIVKSIVYQQLSNKAAGTIYKRFLLELENKLMPVNVLNLTDFQYKKAGLSSIKKSYLNGLAHGFKNRTIILDDIHEYSNEEIIEILTSIRGLGRWSAEMFLIFSLNRLDVLPMSDIGFKRSLKINYNLDEMPNNEKIYKISNKWGQFKSIAVWYLWQALNRK